MLIRDLFVSDVTRDIPPVVYFHEQSPEKLQAEVSEYIITGGYPEAHPGRRRVPDGIHEQYVRLLGGIGRELEKPGGPELPTAWISGFYGSGKSSFAKLLGLALDGVALPGGRSLAEAWLQRNLSDRRQEMRDAWHRLRQKIDPLAVVFDVGGIARDNEHIHSAAVRQIQQRLGYCTTDPLVANFELKLERDGEWPRFLETARETLGQPWDAIKGRDLAEEGFSEVMAAMFPTRYTDPMAWYTARAGTHLYADSPEEAVTAIQDMLKIRRPGATLFLVVDEVAQYVLANKDRVDRLRAFATALGAKLRGKVWLLALGQQQLDEEADDSFLIWARDRFPPALRVHLANTNIRDVVHQRLLRKTPDGEQQLRQLFEHHRAELKLYAHGCEAVTTEEFVEVYPLLPGYVDLLLRITSALRTRSRRVQGDDQAIRGLLQLLGELFRGQRLAELPMGALVTLDRVYDVQYTALDTDVQASMSRLQNQCANDGDDLRLRAAKVVALLELIQDTTPTDAKLVAQCLYDRLDLGNRVGKVTEALESLRQQNLLGYSEKQGYKIQSSAGEEWERERRDIDVSREAMLEALQEELKYLLADLSLPRRGNREFRWEALFSDGRLVQEQRLLISRDEAVITVDLRWLLKEERIDSKWITRSAEVEFQNRLLWLAGDSAAMEDMLRDLGRSRKMVDRYQTRQESLTPARRVLLQEEKNRKDDLETRARACIAGTWLDGKFYFRGRPLNPRERGSAFATALLDTGNQLLAELYPHLMDSNVQPAELLQLLEPELSGPSAKFLVGDLGILSLERGRYEPTCEGIVPRRVQDFLAQEQGSSGGRLLSHFGGPPYGYPPAVVKACVAGLLRAGRVRIQPDGGPEINALRDPGVRDLFDRDRGFRRAEFFPARDSVLTTKDRARICRFFEEQIGQRVERENDAIANGVMHHFPTLVRELREVHEQLNRLPDSPATPLVLETLHRVLEQCIQRSRETLPTVSALKTHLDTLRDGVQQLRLYHAELTGDAIQAVREAARVLGVYVQQLREVAALSGEAVQAAARLEAHLQTERPWRDIAALAPELASLREAYRRERGRRLEWQGLKAEAVRQGIKRRQGFSTLTADQSHHVLRPITEAMTLTSAEEAMPTLKALEDSFLRALQEADDEANARLDEILNKRGETEPVQPVEAMDLGLRQREVGSEADVEALVTEIRERLLARVRAGVRVRLK